MTTTNNERAMVPARGRDEPASEVQALLSVDAGVVLAGTMVFLQRRPAAIGRRVYAMLAVALGAVAGIAAATGVGREPVGLLGLLGLLAAAAALAAAPARAAVPAGKRRALVITRQGLIVRDERGLRSWRFAELAEVSDRVRGRRTGMSVVARDGTRSFVETNQFERGERVRELAHRRVVAARTRAELAAVPILRSVDAETPAPQPRATRLSRPTPIL